MSAAGHARILRQLLHEANGCRVMLTQDEFSAIADAAELYDDGKTESQMIRTPQQKCFECDSNLDMIGSSTGDDPEPGEGTPVVCKFCGAIYALTAEKRIRELTLRERAELAGDHDRMRGFHDVHPNAHFARSKTTLTSAAGR